jgi:glycine betaine/proline transport system permease protein
VSAPVVEAPAPTEPPRPGVGAPAPWWQRPRLLIGAGVVALWVIVWSLTKGNQTEYLPGTSTTDLHDWFTDLREDLIAGRETNPIMQVTTWLADAFNSVVEWCEHLIAVPDLPRPVPQIGWLGVIAIATWIGYAIASWRIALLVACSFFTFAYLGFWEDSMATLITVLFTVAISVVVGMPIAIWAALSRTADAVVRPILDFLQTLPSLTYLLPVVLFFGIGYPAGIVSSFLYAVPVLIRIASHGVRSVPKEAIEATDSIGQTFWQRLRKVQLPMAKRTIFVGVNQATMAALSMVVIAAFAASPGLGVPVKDGLTLGEVGAAFVPGLCLVIMAIMLDRTTTAASERAEKANRKGGWEQRFRRPILAISGVAVLGVVWLSRRELWAAEVPSTSLGEDMATKVQSASDWFTSNFGDFTAALKDEFSFKILNPLQDLLAESPWWIAAIAILALSLLIGGVRSGVTTVVCLAGIYLLDVWNDAMITLVMTVIGTAMVMILAVVFGVWMARRRSVDLALRPLLDAGQVMPPFVYLIPALALFEPTRFTGIVAAVIYAAPIAIKIVADGVVGVDPTSVEAARASGSSAWQVITKVQLPMARESLVLAANQGLLYVLSMMVIAGFVGGGALGFAVDLGFTRSEYFGKAFAAGLAIVLLGIMLDRITRHAAARRPTYAMRAPGF